MKIGVIGAGNIGGTIGRKWQGAGHTVAFGVRSPATSVADAVNAAEVVLIAIPGNAVAATLASIGAKLEGKIVIDATNTMGGPAMNASAAILKAAPGAHVYRAFNSVGWENFENPKFGDVQADLFYAGPDGDPRKVVEQLIADVGLRPVRVGGVEKIPVVDAVASLWFALALGEKKGRRVAFKVLGL
jgi:predicted dinucleotide-binding enzyme